MKLFNSNDFKPSLEELEIEKIVNKDEQLGSLAFDELYDEPEAEVKQEDVTNKENPEPATDAAQG